MVMENSLLARHEGCIPAGLDVGWNPHSITTSGKLAPFLRPVM